MKSGTPIPITTFAPVDNALVLCGSKLTEDDTGGSGMAIPVGVAPNVVVVAESKSPSLHLMIMPWCHISLAEVRTPVVVRTFPSF